MSTQEFTAWDYPADYLKQFPAHFTGRVGDLFCRQVRVGFKTVPSVLTGMALAIEERLAAPFDSDSDQSLAVQQQILESLPSDEAAEFARFILWRESLPVIERERLKSAAKAEKGDFYAKQAMADKEPTEKQLWLIRKKGCVVVPQTRLEASEIIDRLLKGEKVSA